jgi:hypothetical protein
MVFNANDQRQINRLEIQEKKWNGRLSKYWFLLPTGGNGLLSVILTLNNFNLGTLSTGAIIASAISLFFIYFGSIFCLVCVINVRTTRHHINATLRRL